MIDSLDDATRTRAAKSVPKCRSELVTALNLHGMPADFSSAGAGSRHCDPPVVWTVPWEKRNVASDSKTSKPESPSARYRRLIRDGSLYGFEPFTDSELAEVASSVGADGLRIDLHCPSCKQGSTFLLPPIFADGLGKVMNPQGGSAIPSSLTNLVVATYKPISREDTVQFS